ncbi:sugar phosphate isomerase/epimerase family protein [Lactobacillus sp. UCMA15818]|uniref:sugar phosphate isomerase/epimerase family protein n=1 Tax=Lactobacillus sp. UCMA15818 TaxID=2583394 RepID=UPI0025AEEDED|nr:sugar phosphate isomerase/epimerase family protein [Lactobacillus sp. UCMA15818]MDN2453160.1 sugar phosphate isomerase/epimerase [Lactobacillus sp. UCMA15818]
MELGIRAHDVQIFDDIDNLSNKLSNLGFSYIQFAPRVSLAKTTSNGENISFGLANKVKWSLERNNIQIALLGCYVNIIHPNLTKRKREVKIFQKYLSMSSSFGSALVATETGSVDPTFHLTSNNYKNKVIDATIEQVRLLVTSAEKCGCLVGIEPGVNHPIYNVAVTKKLVEEIKSPNLKIILDPMNLVLKEKDNEYSILVDAINAFGEKIYAFHIKDYIFSKGEKVGVPIGDGVAPLKKMLNAMNSFQSSPYVILDEIPQKNFEISLKRINKIATEL